MSDLRDLYQELILDHCRKPRNFGRLDHPDRSATGHNPLCGDRLTITLAVADGVVTEARFEGEGCAISTASASLMSELVVGKTIDEIRLLFSRFHGLVTGQGDEDTADLDKLEVFAGVREYPVRVKCATLAWHSLKAALDDDDAGIVTTE